MKILLCSIAVFGAFAATSVKADLVVTVKDTELTVGGTGYVDVLIRSSDSDDLQLINYAFQITDIGTTIGDLRFATQVDSEIATSNYLFNGNSGGWSAARHDAPAFSRMTGGDFTGDFTDASITGSNLLLVRLEVEHFLASGTFPDASLNDRFEISLLPGFDTFAFDSLGEDVDFGTPINGEVTFAAVPEPSSVAFVLSCTIFALNQRRRRAGSCGRAEGLAKLPEPS